MMSLEIFEKMQFLWNKDTVKWNIRSRSLGRQFAENQDFAKRGGFELKLEKFSQKCYIEKCGEQTSVIKMYHRHGFDYHWEIFGKISYFKCHLDHILQVLEAFEMTKFF